MKDNSLARKLGLKLKSSYLETDSRFYSEVYPAKAPNPEYICLNKELVKFLGINYEEIRLEDGLKVLSGSNKLRAKAYAQAYAGHQFGYLTMLGDGRAIIIGEQVTPEEDLYDIQLKGAGKTIYSRGGDGKADLSAMLREYMISEAMHSLGIPTTRSLAVIKTGEQVLREDLREGAILVRVAKSHVRFGTFQFGRSAVEIAKYREFADYVIKRLYPNLINEENKYVSLLETVMKRQIKLVVSWQLVGFVHGVMNTDNMSIACETIDYGPCAFLDEYEPSKTFSSIDRHGRYSYENQPKIIKWNLARFAESLLPLINENLNVAAQQASDVLSRCESIYELYYYRSLGKKLGIASSNKDDKNLLDDLINLMAGDKLDFTNTFYALSIEDKEYINKSEKLLSWYERWLLRVATERAEEVKGLMIEHNPAIIPRNFWIEKALQKATSNNDMSLYNDLLSKIKNPFSYDKSYDKYMKVPKGFQDSYITYCGN